MDINALINTKTQFAPAKTLALQIGQQLEVKIAKADAERNVITLSLGNKSLSVKSNQPVTLTPGQPLKIQVTQVTPSTEFKIIQPELKGQSSANQDAKALPSALRLTLNTATPAAIAQEATRANTGNSGAITNNNELQRTAADNGVKIGQQFTVKVAQSNIPIANNALTLSLGNKDISVQSSQPLALAPGQALKIQVSQITPNIEFKLVEPLPELKGQIPKALLSELRLTLGTTAPVVMGREPANELQRTAADNGVKIGQQFAVKVAQTDIAATAKNTLTLSLGNKDISVQSSQPLTLAPGQALKIQVSQIAPNIEFKLVEPLPELKGQTGQLQNPKALLSELRLTLTPPALPSQQPMATKMVAIVDNKIQLQFVTGSSPAESGQKQTTLLNIERSQLTNAPSTLKIGQNLNLEIIKTGTVPEFKIITPSPHIPEAKIAELMTQFLPRHEAAPIFLNQLIKDLPALMENKSVSQALKDIAAKIIQNLPPKEQLITSQGLKQSITHSGLFLEAKLPATLSQSALINALPELIKNESVPQSLQRIAAELLQNLTQKQPSPTPRSLPPDAAEQAHTLLKTPKPETTSGETKIATPITLSEDFKGNLLKLIHALKQEISQQSEQKTNPIDIELLKNLQNKSENTAAKVVLDQLMSLPKEDNPKQLWVIDLPFIDRQQAETVKIEIQRDKDNKQESGNSDWSVNITITPPELGTIHCAVSYRNDAINTFFNSRNSETTALIKHNLDYLKNQLEASGLKTGKMDAHDGIQQAQSTHPHQLTGKKLFDDKA